MVSNLICQTWITEGTALAQAHRISFKFHSIPALFEVRKLTNLPFVAVWTKLPRLNSIMSEKDNSRISKYFFKWNIVAGDFNFAKIKH